MLNRSNFIISLILCFLTLNLSPGQALTPLPAAKPSLGVWVTVFTSEKVYDSKENTDKLIAACKKVGINHIYLQVFRSGMAYYNSSIVDKSPFETMKAKRGEDPIKYILSQAKKNGIKVHAWVNMMSLAQNTNAWIIKKYGEEILTRDQHGRLSYDKGKKDALDKYYIREDQLFLEPGDKRVRDYLIAVTEEIIKKYPDFSGLHLDYIRYPSATPFAPGSKFDDHGLGYGYGAVNAANFKKSSGLDVKTMEYSTGNYKKWDDWKRKQVTDTVRAVSLKTRAVKPSLEISCAIVPSIERTYLVNFQDWTRWINENLIDYVVSMNYSEDPVLVELRSKSILLPELKNKVHIGLGVYLIKDFAVTKEQFARVRGAGAAGIVIFSYDDLAKDKNLQDYLAKEF